MIELGHSGNSILGFPFYILSYSILVDDTIKVLFVLIKLLMFYILYKTNFQPVHFPTNSSLNWMYFPY